MTDHNLFQEVKEDLERQKLEALWKKYGFWVIILAMGIVVWTASSTAYRSWRAERAQQTTAAFLAATKGDTAKSLDSLQKFSEENAGTNLSPLARLRAGTDAAEKNNKAKATQLFDAVAKDSKADPVFRQLGDLLSVQLQLDSGDAAALSARLQPLTGAGAPWRFSALEAQGYLALRAGDKAKAKQIFTDLSQDARAPQTLSIRASDILRSLD